jgi:hypothetical protein
MSRWLSFVVRALFHRRWRHQSGNRVRFGALILAFIAVGGLLPLARGGDTSGSEKSAATTESPPPAGSETPVERALAQKIDLDFVETPLKDVAASIAKKTGINVLLDNRAITDAGGSADTPITFQIRGIALRSSLRLMLQEHELNFVTDSDGENVLLITSDTKAKEHVVTRVYDAHDLIASHRKITENKVKLDDLVDIITTTIAPTTWTDTGGTGSMSPYDTQLIISQTVEIQEQISELLAAIRQVRDVPQKVIEAGGSVGLDQSDHYAAIRTLLEKRRDLDFAETPLKDIETVLNKLGILAQLDVKAITDAGGSADMPITFKINAVRLDAALRLMLEEHELNYIIDHDVLLITSDTKAKEHVVIECYPVGDLIGETSGKTTKEIDKAYAELVEVVTTNIAPPTWADAGGTGSITPFPLCKALVCAQTGEIHGELKALLAKLRAGQTKESASAQPTQTTGAFAMRVYQLAPDHADAATDYLEVIRNLVEPQIWKGHGAFLGKVPGAIIARCSPATHERIELLLDELQALPRPAQGGGAKSRGGPPIGGLGGGSGAF